MFKSAIKRGLILALIISVIALFGMGIIDFVVFAVIGLLVLIAAGVSTIVHNQRIDKE